MDDLELIKEKINLVDLVGEYLPLKKAGVNFKTNCPFHNEKTPSFVVSAERQIWHCFGCNKGGDIFKFMMEKEGLEFKDALELLAKRAGVVLQRRGKSEKATEKERLIEIHLKAQEFFHYLLIKHKLGKPALEYLHKRGLTDETIEEFGVGYAPNSWDSLTKFLLKRDFTVAEIILSGLGVESRNGCYDRFRGRIMFPLIDTKNQVIAFAGRVLQPAEPKYLNTPQTPIFDKGNFLFALNLAKAAIRDKKEVVLVEGEMDVIMSHQTGVKNVVASKGTGLTQSQVEILKKYTDTLTLCFDTDIAGDVAARRGIDIAEKAGMNIKVIVVKEGKDPADLVLKDPKQWEEAVKDATPIYDYYIESTAKRYSTSNPSDLRKISQELIPIWAQISDDLVREHYIQKLAALVRSDDSSLRQSINKFRTGNNQSYAQVLQTKPADSVSIVKSRRELLEEYLIALLLHLPKDHTFVPKFPETLFTTEKWKQIYVLLVIYLDSISFKGKQFNVNDFVKDIPLELKDEIDEVYLTELEENLYQKTGWQKEVDNVTLELKKALVKASLEKLSFDIKSAQEFGKIEVVESLNRKFRDLSLKLRNL